MNTNDFPLVSILIPYYNHNHFIRQTLDSIIGDTYPNKEILIINDGSSDPDDSNIIKWIEQYRNKISVTYIKRENLGVTRTINELIDLAQGKYIVLIASDDFLINNTILKRVQLLEKNPHKMVVISDNQVVDDDGKVLYQSNLFELREGKKKNYFFPFGIKREFIKRWGLAGPCFMVNKKVYDIIGKYNQELIVEDWDFFLRAAAKNLIIFYDQPVSAYRLHGNNTITNKSKSRQMAYDLAQTAKNNIKNFDSWYFKFLLWKRYKKIMKIVENFDKGFKPLLKKGTFKRNTAIARINYRNNVVGVYGFIHQLVTTCRYLIRKYFKS